MDEKPNEPKRPVDDARALKKKQNVDDAMREHLASPPTDAHLLVTEHAADLEPWQLRALLARFHAHGLKRTSRIHPDVFKAALDAALTERV